MNNQDINRMYCDLIIAEIEAMGWTVFREKRAFMVEGFAYREPKPNRNTTREITTLSMVDSAKRQGLAEVYLWNKVYKDITDGDSKSMELFLTQCEADNSPTFGPDSGFPMYRSVDQKEGE